MTWTKTPDDYPDRLMDLSDAAYRLHHAATTYANRVGLDGLIPRARISLVPVPTRTRRKAVVNELVGAGLWLETEVGYQLSDFFAAQLSAEEVGLTRDYNAIRQALRFAKGPDGAQKRASLENDKRSVLERLNEARERRRAQSHTATSTATHMPPSRPVPSRPAPIQERGRETTSDAPRGAPPSPTEMAPFDLEILNGSRCFKCLKPIAEDEPGQVVSVRFTTGVRDRLFHDDCAQLAPQGSTAAATA